MWYLISQSPVKRTAVATFPKIPSFQVLEVSHRNRRATQPMSFRETLDCAWKRIKDVHDAVKAGEIAPGDENDVYISIENGIMEVDMST